MASARLATGDLVRAFPVSVSRRQNAPDLLRHVQRRPVAPPEPPPVVDGHARTLRNPSSRLNPSRLTQKPGHLVLLMPLSPCRSRYQDDFTLAITHRDLLFWCGGSMPRGVRLFKRKRGGIEPENASLPPWALGWPGAQGSGTTAPANNIEVTSYLAGCFVAGLGLPPAFFLDEKLTGPNQRAVNGKAQRKFDRRKQVAARLGRSAWVRVIGDAIAAGTLPGTDGWARCDFIGPSKITIDAGREMAKEREDVARGPDDPPGSLRQPAPVLATGDGPTVRGDGLHPGPGARGLQGARHPHRNGHGQLRFGIGQGQFDGREKRGGKGQRSALE